MRPPGQVTRLLCASVSSCLNGDNNNSSSNLVCWGVRLVIICEALREVTGMSEALRKCLLNKKPSREVSWGHGGLYKQELHLNLEALRNLSGL